MNVPKKKRNKKKKKKTKPQLDLKFIAESAPGCHIVHYKRPCDWVIEPAHALDLDEYGLESGDDIPDLSIDPETGVLTAFNASLSHKSFYLSTPCECRNVRGQVLAPAAYRDDQGLEGRTTTLILTLEPMTVLEVCQLNGADLFSHISDLGPPLPGRGPHDGAERPLGFPLGGEGSYLCSQGRGGGLSHFTSATQDAIDLECEVGTPVLAVGNGTVLEVRDQLRCTGPLAANLFHWNSVLLQLDSGSVVEYVHIRHASARVAPGDRVETGQLLCESGDVGFCPVPHLHFQCHESSAPDAPTVPFMFKSSRDDSLFLPLCGLRYSAAGPE
jgi:murein DD-endopeptidase MepM/ murein hydrolase activator NlpD